MPRRFTPLSCAWLLAAAVSAGALSQESAVAPADALARYVARPDDTYQWRFRQRDRRDGTEIIELNLESQTWQGILWKHRLFVIRPARVRDSRHAVMIVGGGRWREEFEAAAPLAGDGESAPDDIELFVAIARALRSPVVVLGQVPYQPMFGLREDSLIAHTFDRFLATGNSDWPLLLPMVKSVVRAFDASNAFSESEWGAPLESFTLIGGSKRGWTTWLAAAVDSRVTAFAPVVIDVLNMERHFPHQVEAWGAPSERIRPYTDLGLDRILGSADGEPLRQIVDPYRYRARLTQPKLVMLATNDAFFPLDSANLYWDGLPEPKRLLYLPNEAHEIDDFGPVVRGLRALHEAAGGGKPLPQLAWEYRWGETLTLCVATEPKARELRVWQATSSERDLRGAEWWPAVASNGSNGRFEVARPESGYVAVFGEAKFGRGFRAFVLSTNLAVLAAADEPAYGTEPRGSPGVCAEAGHGPILTAP